MRALIVGFGRMGQRYERALKNIAKDALDLTTVDLVSRPERGAKHFLNLGEIPNSIQFDIVIDARPNEDRLSVLQFFLERGVPKIIVEKPHATSMAESAEMIGLGEKYAKRSQIMLPFYMRYLESFALKTFANLQAGKLLAMHVNAGALGLGCNGIHLIDLSTQLFDGLPTSIYGQLELNQVGSPRGPKYRDHGGLMIINFGERIFTMTLHSHSSIGTNTTYVFEHGKIQVNEQSDPHWTWWRRAEEHDSLPVTRTHLEQKVHPDFVFDFNLEKSMVRGISSLLAGDKVPSLRDGHNALKFVALAEVSTRQRRLISWDEEINFESVQFKFT